MANYNDSQADDFPPSQRYACHWDDAQDKLHGDRPTNTNKKPSSVLGKRPASNNKTAIASSSRSTTAAEDALRQKKRRLLEMDDWTGAKALAAPKLPTMYFPQYGDQAPVWGWGGDMPAASSITYPSQPRSSYGRPSDSYSVKLLSQHQPPVETEPGRPSQLWSRRDSLMSTAHGEPSPNSPNSRSRNSSLVSAVSAPMYFGSVPPSGRRSGAYGAISPVVSPPITLSSIRGHERSSVLGSSGRPWHSPQRQQPLSQIAGSWTSPYFVEEEPSTPSNGRSRVAASSHMSASGRSVVSGTLSESEQQRFESEGVAILSPSVPAISGSRLASPVRPSTPSSLVFGSHHTQSVADKAYEREESSQGTMDQYDADEETGAYDNFGQESCVRQVPPINICRLQPVNEYEQAMPLDRELPRRKHSPAANTQRETTPVGARLCLAEHAGDGAGDLFSANRVDIRGIPDWDDGNDPIEDSEQSETETEAFRALLQTRGKGTGQRRTGISGRIARMQRGGT